MEDLLDDINCVKEVRVHISMDDITIAVESQGSSFWSKLLGGVAGCALGGLGSALGSVISTKGQIASMTGTNATNAVNDVLSKSSLSLANIGQKLNALSN